MPLAFEDHPYGPVIEGLQRRSSPGSPEQIRAFPHRCGPVSICSVGIRPGGRIGRGRDAQSGEVNGFVEPSTANIVVVTRTRVDRVYGGIPDDDRGVCQGGP